MANLVNRLDLLTPDRRRDFATRYPDVLAALDERCLFVAEEFNSFTAYQWVAYHPTVPALCLGRLLLAAAPGFVLCPVLIPGGIPWGEGGLPAVPATARIHKMITFPRIDAEFVVSQSIGTHELHGHVGDTFATALVRGHQVVIMALGDGDGNIRARL